MLAFALLVPAAPASAATGVSACGTNINSPGSYILTQDIDCTGGASPNGAGIHINAAGVTLNLNGKTITGGDFGVTIGVFSLGGLPATGSKVGGPGTVTQVTGGAFILGNYAAQGGFTGVTATNNFVGLSVQANTSAVGNFVRGSVFTGNRNGMQLSSGATEIAYNDCSNNNQAGSGHIGMFILAASDKNDVFENTCSNNSSFGILLQKGSIGNSIHGNTATGSGLNDAQDGNTPSCSTNQWFGNTFGTFAPACAGNAPLACTITGDDTNNTLNGTPGNDVICGLGGNDTINGLGGNDVLDGGPGTDMLDGGAGADVIKGGAGVKDQVRYSVSKVGVTIDLSSSNGPADGAPGEGDDVRSDVEGAVGSNFDDVIIGNDTHNTLYGKDGDDSMYGHLGNDVLYGDAGVDDLHGDDDGSAADILTCGADGGTAFTGPGDTTDCAPVTT